MSSWTIFVHWVEGNKGSTIKVSVKIQKLNLLKSRQNFFPEKNTVQYSDIVEIRKVTFSSVVIS